MATKPAAFYVPIDYDPAVFPSHWQDYANFFLNLVHWKRICWQLDETEFVRLKRDYIVKIIPRKIWPTMRHRLERNGVIECDNRVVVGAKALGFRLAEEYQGTYRIVCNNAKLNRKIREVYESDLLPLQPIHRKLEDHLSCFRFNILRSQNIIAKQEPDEGISTAKYRAVLRAQCQCMVNGDFGLTADRFGRVHSLLTRLPKELRCCLRFGTRPIAILDLRNSQPLLAGLCAREYFASAKTRWRLRRSDFTQSKDPYVQRIVAGPSDIEDLERYVRTCERGEIYHSLSREGESTDRCKLRFLTEIMFGKNCYRSPLKTQFESSYPSVASMLQQLKFKNYRRAAWILQNYEASIFIGVIARRLLRDTPKLPIATLHDGFVAPASDAEHVKGVILDEFQKRFQLQPQVSIDRP